MSNILVEGFATYGTGNAGPSDTVGRAMLAGAWAQMRNNPGMADGYLSALPWDTSDTDLFYRESGGATVANTIYPMRRALPVTADPVIFSLYFATAYLPTAEVVLMSLRNGSNANILQLTLTSTGAINAYSVNGSSRTLIGATSGPVIVAETASHLEMKLSVSAGAFELRVNGVSVINLSALTFPTAGPVAQFVFADNLYLVSQGILYDFYYGNLIIRDTTGTVNNDFAGDRRVATLFVNSDDPSHQGWTPRPLQRFGDGVLDMTSAAAVSVASTVLTDLGNGDYTLESQVRFQTLPTGANKAIIFNKWDETNNKRSYQLYKAGPSLENGYITFQISTDGTDSTVTQLIQEDWQPEVGQWYHIAVSRVSGVTSLYVDGKLIGVGVADANTYFAGSARTAIGARYDGGTYEAQQLDGWFDETRFTVGVARYTAPFAPPTDAFPRAGGDPSWANVAWLMSYDNGVVADDGPNALTVTKYGAAAAITPDDGDAAYKTLNKAVPDDDTFIEAALLTASDVLTVTALPADGETVTVGTKDGSTAAVYTWKTTLTGAAFEVLIGASVSASLDNLVSAINASTGAGTTYGTGTTANNDVSAYKDSNLSQMHVDALTPGTAGNSIAASTTAANESWANATLTGGADIPSYSQFGLHRLPSDVTVVDSVTIVQRAWKVDAGASLQQASFVGSGGGVESGTAREISTVPTLYFDTFEHDPDNVANPITPTAVLLGKIRIDRTA